MKKTPFIISLMAALLAIQPALANVFDGGSDEHLVNTYIGAYSTTDDTSAWWGVTVESGNGNYGEDFFVYGGYTSATGKGAGLSKITMNGGSVLNACGGYSDAGAATYNGVTIKVGEVEEKVYGGWSKTGEGTEWNTVTLGDASESSGEPKAYAQTVYGGYSGDGGSWDNGVTVKADGSAVEVYGGVSEGYKSYDNKVTVNGTVAKSIAGGVGGTDSYSNSVTIGNGAKVGSLTGAHVYGGSSANDSYQNTVTISDGAVVSCDVYGGTTTGDENTDFARQNTITVKGGNMGQQTSLYGGYSYGNANRNKVEISGGTVSNVYGAYSVNGIAAKNLVIVSGGTVSGTLAGAMGSTVTDNEVHLVGKGVNNLALYSNDSPDTETPEPANSSIVADVDGEALFLGDIHGAICTGDSASSSGNSIDLYGYGITANSMKDMQVLDFHLLNEIKNTDTAVLNLVGTDYAKQQPRLGPELVINFDALDAMTWKPGDSVTLVSSNLLAFHIDPQVFTKVYNIYEYGDPKEDRNLIGTGLLKLEQGGHVLKLVCPNVPEPATGTLSLLALCALTARRRRK